MLIATWNVNSVKSRAEHLQRWLKERAPDVVCLQETKCVDDAFPRGSFEDLGYNIAVHGQKTYNGVAILSKHPFDEVTARLPGDHADDHARFLEAVISVGGGVVRIASIYLPNGNPIDSDKFRYKLAWMERLTAYAQARLPLEEPLVLAGDFNVIPTPADAKHPEKWKNDALFQPETRAKFRELADLGMVDAVRAASDDPGLYTFWDFQSNAFSRDDGIRIDHLMLSPQAADRLAATGIDRAMRGGEKPSDHVPVWIELNLN
jgi:exodeoxyribonuclease III